MFSKILIANRGEIALRVIRACRDMGIKTVAVFSEADRESLHVRLADEKICVGPSSGKESYLNIPSIISAAEISDAEAIHPGYGFLAENHEFAEICEASGINFIGPHSTHIRLMGNKVQARALAAKAGVPVLSGTPEGSLDADGALRAAREMGFPVMIKAAAGGGGRGMRIVHSEASFRAAFSAAQSESQSAFRSTEVYLEKYLPAPRHVEFQILADRHGNVVHLGERECSIQRRYQKLIEESPSPALTGDIRRAMGDAAVALAREVGYFNAGTMEFLVDQDRKFYFMEMNTRIQVEHPVTEMVTGIDLVKEQIRVAAGLPLGFAQKDVRVLGHAIECRINAEDPDDFRPSPGTITFLYTPGGPGIRVDTASFASCYIPPFYDSLVAKLVAFGRDRAEAIARMQRALSEYMVEGIKTSIPLHQRILATQRFRRGEYDTHFLEEMKP